jgi:hypothetical protein
LEPIARAAFNRVDELSEANAAIRRVIVGLVCAAFIGNILLVTNTLYAPHNPPVSRELFAADSTGMLELSL